MPFSDHKTSEALTPRSPDSLGKDNVVEFDRVFAVRGPHFNRYISEVVMPVRQDVATMALQRILGEVARRSPTGVLPPEDVETCVKMAFRVADEFCLTAPVSLDARLKDYFDLYMQRGSLDDILKSAMEAAHDYSL